MNEQRSYLAYFEENEEGGYTVIVPSFDDAATFGETYEEAVAMAEDMIRGFIRIYQEEGIPIPVDSSSQSTALLRIPLRDTEIA